MTHHSCDWWLKSTLKIYRTLTFRSSSRSFGKEHSFATNCCISENHLQNKHRIIPKLQKGKRWLAHHVESSLHILIAFLQIVLGFHCYITRLMLSRNDGNRACGPCLTYTAAKLSTLWLTVCFKKEKKEKKLWCFFFFFPTLFRGRMILK